MEAYQQRVVAERDDLADKVKKLGAFIDGDVFPTLSYAEGFRLGKQYGYMKQYLEVLNERIAHFATY